MPRALLLGLLFVWLAGPASAQTPQDTAALESMGLTPLPDRPASIDFELEDPESGAKTRLSSLRGKFVLLNFWATWCLPCIEELPSLVTLQARATSNNLVILAVSSGEDRQTVRTFLGEHHFRLNVVADYQGSVSEQYGVRALPTTYLIDPSGRVVAGKVGAQNWASPAFIQGLSRLR